MGRAVKTMPVVEAFWGMVQPAQSSPPLLACREAGSGLRSPCSPNKGQMYGANRLFPAKSLFWVNGEYLEICAECCHPHPPLAHSIPTKSFHFNLFRKEHFDFLFHHKIHFEICWKVVCTFLSLKGFCLGDGKTLRDEVRHLQSPNQNFYMTKTKKTGRNKKNGLFLAT